jgi:hypothetical protein
MNKPAGSSETASAQRGLIGFFDVLGYRSIIENNPIGEVIPIVKKIQDTLDEHQKHLNDWADSCGHVMFSDSIVVYAPFSEAETRHKNAGFFAEFCAGLLNDLFWAGLPVRGAWAFGDFYIDLRLGKVCLAGMPIVEAYNLSNCVELAGCVLAPSAETFLSAIRFLDTSSESSFGFIQYPVPLKGHGKQKLYILDHSAFDRYNERHSEISRQIVIERFSGHNKRIGVEVLPKVNNTFEFLEASKNGRQSTEQGSIN